jgi:hypothetical protein
MSNKINKSVYRGGGSISWGSTIGEVIACFNEITKYPACGIIIGAAEKGYGKSTAFEYIYNQRGALSGLDDSFNSGIFVEGDIMSVLGAVFYSELDYEHDMKLTDISNGMLFDGWIPWAVEWPADKSTAMHDCLSKQLGDDYFKKISLCTYFNGSQRILEFNNTFLFKVCPEYNFYSKNLKARVDAIVADGSQSKEWKERIKKKHVVMDWKQFLDADIAFDEKFKGISRILQISNLSTQSLATSCDNAISLISYFSA